jgi:pSer/pThr/pTyr-binding forkhead associated (FHA) protein
MTSRTPPGTNQSVTFQVLDGVDKGRVFRDLSVPFTIGREEGNNLRLNDERVSRFHAKVQQDNNDLILTDLESTNGTRVNGHVVQIRRLRFGDQIALGRSVLLFGSDEEIEERRASLHTSAKPQMGSTLAGSIDVEGPPTVQANTLSSRCEADCDFDLNIKQDVTVTDGEMFVGQTPLPPLPQKMSPSQAARMAEILDFLHHHLSQAAQPVKANDEATQITLSFADWQGILAVQKLLAKYLRAITEPDALGHQAE